MHQNRTDVKEFMRLIQHRSIIERYYGCCSHFEARHVGQSSLDIPRMLGVVEHCNSSVVQHYLSFDWCPCVGSSDLASKAEIAPRYKPPHQNSLKCVKFSFQQLFQSASKSFLWRYRKSGRRMTQTPEPTPELKWNATLGRWIDVSFAVSSLLLVALCVIITLRCVQVRRLSARGTGGNTHRRNSNEHPGHGVPGSDDYRYQ